MPPPGWSPVAGQPTIQPVPGPIAALLLILSIAVLTVILDRIRWWFLWWQRRHARRRSWAESLSSSASSLPEQIEDWELEMAFGEPLLRASALLAPLLGLAGTVLALMQMLSTLGPDLTLPADTQLQGYGGVLLSTALGLVLCLVASAGLELNQGLRRWQIGRHRRQWRRGLRTSA